MSVPPCLPHFSAWLTASTPPKHLSNVDQNVNHQNLSPMFVSAVSRCRLAVNMSCHVESRTLEYLNVVDEIPQLRIGARSTDF